jgi:hypothetical protein
MTRFSLCAGLVLAAAFSGVAAAEASRPAASAQVPQAAQGPQAPKAPAAPKPAPQAVQAAPLDDRGARDTREWLNKVLEQYPPSVRDVLRIDPSLLSQPDYLATYPTLAAFLEQHPEVAHNPAYFVGTADRRSDDGRAPDVRIESIRAWQNFAEMIPVVAIVFIITSALAGLIRTFIDQRRWKRAAQMQMDMQNKLVDRFSGGNELLAYLQSPAGRGLADIHAPLAMPVSLGSRMMDAPVSRIFWPLQAGIVVTAAGIGLHFLGNRIGITEMSEPVSGFGALVVAIGIGFIVSAVASFFLSHRLGLVPAAPNRSDFGRGTPDA